MYKIYIHKVINIHKKLSNRTVNETLIIKEVYRI